MRQRSVRNVCSQDKVYHTISNVTFFRGVRAYSSHPTFVCYPTFTRQAKPRHVPEAKSTPRTRSFKWDCYPGQRPSCCVLSHDCLVIVAQTRRYGRGPKFSACVPWFGRRPHLNHTKTIFADLTSSEFIKPQILRLCPTLDSTRKWTPPYLAALALSITVLKHPPTPSTFIRAADGRFFNLHTLPLQHGASGPNNCAAEPSAILQVNIIRLCCGSSPIHYNRPARLS